MSVSPIRPDHVSAIPETVHKDQRRYATGLPAVDALMTPLRAGEFCVIGALEGQGKSAFAETMALANADRVLFVSLEMTAEELRDRLLVKITRQPLDEVHRQRAFGTDDYTRAKADLARRDLHIWHPASASVRAITEKAESLHADLTIIDYSRMIAGWGGFTQCTAIVNQLASWASESSHCVVLLSQLRPDAYGVRPNASHLQDTGALKQRADRVVLLYRPFKGEKDDRICEVIVEKNRLGPSFRRHAHWVGETMSFFDMEDDLDAAARCCARRSFSRASKTTRNKANLYVEFDEAL